MNSQFYQKIFLLYFSLTNAISINNTDVENDYELNTLENTNYKTKALTSDGIQTESIISNDSVDSFDQIQRPSFLFWHKLLLICLKYFFIPLSKSLMAFSLLGLIVSILVSIQQSIFYLILMSVFSLLHLYLSVKCSELERFIYFTS